AFVFCERFVLADEQTRLRMAEAVNALFYVADHEHIAAFTADRPDDRLLHQVDVLILINQYFFEFVLIILGDSGRNDFTFVRTRFGQNGKRKMFQIVEIDDGTLTLDRLETFFKLQNEVNQVLDDRIQFFHIGSMLRQTAPKEALFQAVPLFAECVADFFDRLFFRFVTFNPFRREVFKFRVRHKRLQIIPRIDPFQRFVDQLPVRFERIKIMIWTVRFTGDLHRSFDSFFESVQLYIYFLFQQL